MLKNLKEEEGVVFHKIPEYKIELEGGKKEKEKGS